MACAQEEILVLKAQAGDSRAFEILYRAYQPSLAKFAYRLTGNEASAMDAVQDAWIMTARKLKELDNPAMFRARIFKAVRWRALDQIRRQTGAHLSLDDEALDVESAPRTRDGLLTSDQLTALIGSLPEIERQAIYLFYLEEMKVAEIATVLDIPPGTVKSRLNRARARLQEQVEREDALEEV